MAGGDSGRAIVPGDSANSVLIHLVSGLDPKRVMPAEGERLTAERERIGPVNLVAEQELAELDEAPRAARHGEVGEAGHRPRLRRLLGQHEQAVVERLGVDFHATGEITGHGLILLGITGMKLHDIYGPLAGLSVAKEALL